MNYTDTVSTDAAVIVPTYKRAEVLFERGEGLYLFDSEGKRYLDFSAGIAVTALGHADPEWVAAVSDQAAQLAHVSNLYHTKPQVQLAQRLVQNSFASRVFFCNSGTEANEAALKFARKFAGKHFPEQDKHGILAFHRGFHGRTIGALSVTANENYREPFGPLMPGVGFSTFNDLDEAAARIGAATCAVIVEPVQGEGGVHPATQEFLKVLRALCDEHNALLIFDEIQCGLGRTGKLWAYEQYGVVPDIMTLAKPLAGGLPIGATLVTEDVANAMEPGDHGSTFAAGPLVCRAAEVVFDRVATPSFLQSVQSNSEYLMHRLRTLESEHIVEVRGAGLLLGVEFDQPVADVVATARDQGVIVINAGENVLRLCPPLIVARAEIDTAIGVLEACIDEMELQ